MLILTALSKAVRIWINENKLIIPYTWLFGKKQDRYIEGRHKICNDSIFIIRYRLLDFKIFLIKISWEYSKLAREITNFGIDNIICLYVVSRYSGRWSSIFRAICVYFFQVFCIEIKLEVERAWVDEISWCL